MELIKLLKINNYVKNLAILLPLFFSISLFNLNYITTFLNIFITFCLASSGLTLIKYLFEVLFVSFKNGVKIKNFGLPFKMLFVAVIFIVISYFIAKHYNCTIFLNIYFIFNVLYMLFLKRINYSEVFEIVINSILFLYLGCSLLGYNPYLSIVLFVLFLSLFFGFTIRKVLLQDLFSKNNVKYYPDIKKVKRYILFSAIFLIFSYIYFVFDDLTIKMIATVSIAYSIVPFIGIIFRLLTIINQDDFILSLNMFIQDKVLRNWTIAFFIIYLLSCNAINLI